MKPLPMLVVATALAAGCSSTSTEPGTITGIMAVGRGGGPLGAAKDPAHPYGYPTSGSIVIASTGHARTVTVGPSGQFNIRLSPGDYTLVGHPHIQSGCTPQIRVTVKPAAVTHANLVCTTFKG